MAVLDNLKGSITLSFFKRGPGSSIIQLKSSNAEYLTTADAYNAAVEALEKFPHIEYANINFTPRSGSVRTIEKVTRGPLFYNKGQSVLHVFVRAVIKERAMYPSMTGVFKLTLIEHVISICVLCFHVLHGTFQLQKT